MEDPQTPSTLIGDLIRRTEDRLGRERELLRRLRAVDASAPADWPAAGSAERRVGDALVVTGP